MQVLTEREEKFYSVFRNYKSFARKEYLAQAGFSEEEQAVISASLVTKGYLSVNKLGHLKETTQAQKARLGGKTASQYVADMKAKWRAEEAAAWNATFGKGN